MPQYGQSSKLRGLHMLMVAVTNPWLCDVINQRRLLTFTYRRRRLEVIPAALGTHATTGDMVLRAYVLRGRRSVGRMGSPWRLFRVDRMRDTVALPKIFDDPPPGYDPDDRLLGAAICQL